MKQTEFKQNVSPITCDMKTLQEITGLGRQSLDIIGKEAKARIKVGRRTLYLVSKIEEYLYKLAENEEE